MTEAYVAEHLWLMTSALYAVAGGELHTPRYTDILYPEKANVDNRTAEEIKADIVRKLVGE